MLRIVYLLIPAALITAALIFTFYSFEEAPEAAAAPSAEPPRYAATGVQWLRLGSDGQPEFRVEAATFDYFADESVGFKYPDAYNQFFGPDFTPPEYLQRAHQEARNHRWYMTSRLITIYDVYAFQDGVDIDPEIFTDIVGRPGCQ